MKSDGSYVLSNAFMDVSISSKGRVTSIWDVVNRYARGGATLITL